MAEIIINCAADLDLAEALFNYMLSFLNPIDKNVSIELKSDEIYINYDIDKDALRRCLCLCVMWYIDQFHHLNRTREIRSQRRQLELVLKLLRRVELQERALRRESIQKRQQRWDRVLERLV